MGIRAAVSIATYLGSYIYAPYRYRPVDSSSLGICIYDKVLSIQNLFHIRASTTPHMGQQEMILWRGWITSFSLPPISTYLVSHL